MDNQKSSHLTNDPGLHEQPHLLHPKDMSLNELADILSLTIKHDYENKVITFLAMLSAYTYKSQINVSFNAPSSSGKTYITHEVAKLFPDEDKIESSGASPTSFYHGEGVFDQNRKAKVISLSRKILILYEQHDPLFQAKLRPVLSHDQWDIKLRITNKQKSGENRAELIIIEGFPATIFCSAGLRLDEQEATRAILLSPEVTEDKLKEGVHLQAIRGANEDEFELSIESNAKRVGLMERIIAIREENVDDIVISDTEAIEKRFYNQLGAIRPRHMRDMGHLMRLIKAVALLNVWHRRGPTGGLVVSQSDVDQGFELWSKFTESQELGISPALMLFYKKYIVPCYLEKKTKEVEADTFDMLEAVEPMGISRQELSNYYLRLEESPLNDDYLRKQILPQLTNCGLIQQGKPSTGDKRSMHIYPQVFYDENNIGNDGVLTEKEVNPIVDPFDH